MHKKRSWKAFVVIPLILAGLYLFAIMPGFRSQKIAEPFSSRMYAHRGIYDNDADNPENSLAAFELACSMNYGIEMDVQMSKDGVPVIFHDDTLNRMVRNKKGKKVKGSISDYTIDELKQFHLKKSSQTIPTLDEFLRMVDGRVPVIVEYKADAGTDVNALCSACDERLRSYEGDYCIQSFSSKVLLWYRIHNNEIMRGQLSGRYSLSKDSSLVNIVEENVLLNFITKPDFISYNCKNYRNPSRTICRNVFNNVSVGWTIRSQEQLDGSKDHFDLFIFDGFLPKEETSGSL